MPEPGIPKKKILLVEDDEFLRSLLIERFVQAGYEVSIAKSGAEALSEAGKLPDLILLDLVLPDFSGFDVIEKLRQSPETRDLPFMVLSNSEEQESRKQSQELNAVGYLVKARSTPSSIIAAINAYFHPAESPSA
jgi:CheY-like chemotaxis protein